MKRRYFLGIIVLLIGALAAFACGDDADGGDSTSEEFAFGLSSETVVADGADYIVGCSNLDDCLVILLDIDKLLEPEQLDGVRQVSIGGRKNTM